MLHSIVAKQVAAPVTRAAPLLAGLCACTLLASCDDHDDVFCKSCAGPATEYSQSVISADFNGDGVADVIALTTVHPSDGPNPSNLKTYFSAGGGAFAAPVLTPDGYHPLYAANADLNGDGFMDVVSASYDDGALSVFFNNKTSPGTFNSPLQLNSPGASQVAIADMNADGLPDLISADFNVSLFLQTSPGTFATPVALYAGGANWVAAGDLNGDGIPDVALTDAAGVKLLMHTGAAGATTYAAPVSVFTQTLNQNVQGASLIAIADLNGDGLNDLVVTDPGPTGGTAPTVNILLQDPANHGSFLPPVAYAIATQDLPQSIVLADLQGSGALDIVIGGTQTVSVLLHDPANPGKLLAANVYTAAGANQVAVADINADGKPDIVVSNGVTHPIQGGIVTAKPGVLLQSTTTAGTFLALQDLP